MKGHPTIVSFRARGSAELYICANCGHEEVVTDGQRRRKCSACGGHVNKARSQTIYECSGCKSQMRTPDGRLPYECPNCKGRGAHTLKRRTK